LRRLSALLGLSALRGLSTTRRFAILTLWRLSIVSSRGLSALRRLRAGRSGRELLLLDDVAGDGASELLACYALSRRRRRRALRAWFLFVRSILRLIFHEHYPRDVWYWNKQSSFRVRLTAHEE
jgi:hypothetical protein